jgi:hypothetical protein
MSIADSHQPQIRNASAMRKFTVLLDADLERRLHAECVKLGRETGLRVPLSQVAARAMRAGLPAHS